MSDPLSPNYKNGVGRLVTDRFDFQKHVNGENFRHLASQIDLDVPLIVSAVSYNNVQDILAALSAIVAPPVVSDATTSSKGIVQLAGDIGGVATNVQVKGLRGRLVSSASPTNGQVLTWNNGSGVWEPQTVITPLVFSQDINGNYLSQTVVGLQGKPVNTTAPINGDVLYYNAGSWGPSALPSLIPALSGDVVGSITSNIIETITGNISGEVSVAAKTIYLNDTSGTNTLINFNDSNFAGAANNLSILGQNNINASGGVRSGGSINIKSGNATGVGGTSVGGALSLWAGNGLIYGGDTTIKAGNGTNGAGGIVEIRAGNGYNTAGSVTIFSGDANVSGSPNPGSSQIKLQAGGGKVGGDILLYSGDGDSLNGGNIYIKPGKSLSSDHGLIKLYYNDSLSSESLVTVGSTGGTSFVALGEPPDLTKIDSGNPASYAVYIKGGAPPGVDPPDYGTNLPGVFLFSESGKLFVYEGRKDLSPKPLYFQVRPPYMERNYILFDGSSPSSVTLSSGVSLISGASLPLTCDLRTNDEILIKVYGYMNCASSSSVGALYIKFDSGATQLPTGFTTLGINGQQYFSIYTIYKIPSDRTGITFDLYGYAADGPGLKQIDFQLLTFEATAIRP